MDDADIDIEIKNLKKISNNEEMEDEDENQNFIVRDCAWIDSSIITGDFGGNVR